MGSRRVAGDEEWTQSSPSGQTKSVMRITSFTERTSEPSTPSAGSSFSSHIEIKGIRPRSFSPSIRTVMSGDSFFNRPFPRLFSMNPSPAVKLSFSTRSPIQSDAGYGSGSSVASFGTSDASQENLNPQVTHHRLIVEDKQNPVSIQSFDQEGLQGESTLAKKESFIRAVDELEARVAFLRETAHELEIEKQKLLSALQSLEKNSQLDLMEQIDREEVITNANRLILTLETVTVTVVTRRSVEQAEAIRKLNALLDFLEKNLRSSDPMDQEEAIRMAHIFLNSCSSENEAQVEIDDKFQKQVIECAGDDQKRIRKRLEHLVQEFKPKS